MQYPPNQCRTEEQAREHARKRFIEEFGHKTVDIPLITDARGKAEFVRYRLREFLDGTIKITKGARGR